MDDRELRATVFYNAGELTYNFPFDYIKKSFVMIKYVDKIEADYIDEGQILLYGTDYTINDKQIILKEKNTTNKYICIYRSTATSLITTFSDGSLLKASNMNISNVQLLHLNEELSDYIVIHKLPSGFLQKIEEAIKVTEDNAVLTKEYLDEILSIYTLIKECLDDVILYTKSIKVKSFNNVNEMISSNNITEGDLVRTKGYISKLDKDGALYSIESGVDSSSSYIKLQNNLYAIKMRDAIDTDKILYKDINIESILNSYISFYYIDTHLVMPSGTFIINNKFYLLGDLFNITFTNDKLRLFIKKEGR